MDRFINEIIGNISELMNNFGFLSGFILIIFESMIPILPLAVFITINIITYGELLGFIISWIATIIGCILMFLLCKKLQNKFLKKYNNNTKIMNIKKNISNISFSNLVVIIAIPFTPAFAVNIGAGLSDISTKKYFSALLIGKLPMVYFWAFIGKSLIESLSDFTILIRIIFMLVLVFFISKVINKFLKL